MLFTISVVFGVSGFRVMDQAASIFFEEFILGTVVTRYLY